MSSGTAGGTKSDFVRNSSGLLFENQTFISLKKIILFSTYNAISERQCLLEFKSAKKEHVFDF